jgi:hypothetical protein
MKRARMNTESARARFRVNQTRRKFQPTNAPAWMMEKAAHAILAGAPEQASED